MQRNEYSKKLSRDIKSRYGESLNNAEAGMKYTLNGTEMSYDEYIELCGKIFAAQVNTN